MARNKYYFGEETDKLLLDVMKRGGSVAHFCVEADISEREYYNWVADVEGFREVHEKGLALSKKYWLDVGEACLNDKTFDTKNWKTQLNARFSNNRIFLPELKKCNSIVEKFACIFHAVADASINIEQADKLASICHKEAQCAEMAELSARVAALESAGVGT
jgi:hypothetical protein